VQSHQSTPAQRLSARNRTNERSAIPGTLTTVLSIGAVVLIVAITFLADFLRMPQVSLSAPGQFLSPNGDGNHDIFTVNYRLKDEARVIAQVFSGDNLIRSLADLENQGAGDYFLTWDGRTDQGFSVEDGIYRLQMTASGPIRSSSQSVVVQVDTQPPQVQLANLNDAMQVNKPDFLIEGITEPGAVIWISGTAQPLIADGAGRFNFQYKLLDGLNNIEIQATDAAGNTTRIQRTVRLETQPPDIILTRPLENEWRNQALVEIEGTTRPGATLTINQQTLRVETDGTFKHQMVLNEGNNVLRIVAVDAVGNTATLERTVYLKTGVAPVQLNIQDGATVADPNLQLVGRAEPGSLVTVNGLPVVVSALGDFQSQTPLNSGENLVVVEVRDLAGNTNTLTRRVVYSESAPLDGLSRFARNLDFLPMLLLPSILIAAGFLAFIYMRQNQVALVLSVDQPIFSPGTPGNEKNLAILLDLSKTARVSLEVLDQKGYPRATILYNRRKIGRRHTFYWNGYDDRGIPVDSGEYTIQAEAGAPPLQVTSAVQVRIERLSMPQAQTPTNVYTDRNISVSRQR
jgi:flagellar hook assembly protein FlgD